MPPWILAAIPIAITAVVTVSSLALFVGPFVIPLWVSTMDEKQRQRILDAVKGANAALGPIVRTTQTDIDNRVFAVLEMVEREIGKSKGKKAVVTVNIAKAVVAKSAADAAKPGVIGVIR